MISDDTFEYIKWEFYYIKLYEAIDRERKPVSILVP